MTTADYLREMLERPRQYATYFDLGDPTATEVGTACDLINSFHDQDKIRLIKGTLRGRGPGEDPPDCEATLVDGSKLGLEVTEFVDAGSIRSQVREGAAPPFDYTRESFLECLERRLVAKIRNTDDLKGGPYSMRVLLIHTDEMLLTHDECRSWLEEHSLTHPTPWDRVYLLFSYSPKYAEGQEDGSRGLPYLRIH